MNKQDRVFDDNYTSGSVTTAEVHDGVDQQLIKTSNDYSQETDLSSQPSAESGTSSSSLFSKYGTSKPYRLKIRGKIIKGRS